MAPRFALAQAAPSWGLPQLMAGLAQVKSATASFTERKTMAVLNAPLVASGTLEYRAPDWMRKSTTSPMPESFVLDGQQVTMMAEGQTHVFALGEDPLIGGLTEGILATLAGNLAALNRVYTVRFSGGPTDWQLVLRPRDAGLTRFVAWLCIRGSETRINTIDTASANGDHSEMSVNETIGNAR